MNYPQKFHVKINLAKVKGMLTTNFIQLQYQPVQLITLNQSLQQAFDNKIRLINQAKFDIDQSIKNQLAAQQEQFSFDQFQQAESQYLDFSTALSKAVIDELIKQQAVKWQKYLTNQRKTMPMLSRTLNRFTAQSQAMLDYFDTELVQVIDNVRVNTVTKFKYQDQQLQLTEQLSNYRSQAVMAVIYDPDYQKMVITRANYHEYPTMINTAVFDISMIEMLAKQWSVDSILVASTRPLVTNNLSNQYYWYLYSINGLLSTSFLNGQSPIWEPAASDPVTNLDPLINASYQLLRRHDIHIIKNIQPYRGLLKG